METNQIEIAAGEIASFKVDEGQVQELNELHLALVGGGIGETVL